MLRVMCSGALALLAASMPATAAQLIDEPKGLAWSSSEVAVAGVEATRLILADAERLHERGCRTHCLAIERVWMQLRTAFRDQQLVRQTALPLTLHVLQSDYLEAFAAPDGTVVLSEAFVRERELTEAQIAFVLAHEVVHVLLEHERETLTAALSLLPNSVKRTVSDVYVELDYNFDLLKSIEPSRHQAEFEADGWGIQLAAMAGYPPEEQLKFMESEAQREWATTALVSTHPSAESRLIQLRAQLPLSQRVYQQSLEKVLEQSADRD